MKAGKIKVLSGKEAAQYSDVFPDTYLEFQEKVIVVDGDLEIESDYSDWYDVQIKKNKLSHSIVIVKGDLRVAGDILDADLLVMGSLHCDYLYSNLARTLILGDAHIRFAYFGENPAGWVKISGTMTVPFLLNENHASMIEKRSENMILVGVRDDGFFDYDLSPKDFGEVINKSIYWEEDEELDVGGFLDLIKEGKSPFKNISDDVFSLNFDKRIFLEKVGISEFHRMKRFTIKKQNDADNALKMPALKSIKIRKIVTLPPALQKNKKVKKLTISSELLQPRLLHSGAFTKAVGKFSYLETLVVEDSWGNLNLDKVAPLLFAELKKLKHLSIEKMTQVGFDQLPNLKSLILTGESSDLRGAHIGLKHLTIENSYGVENLGAFTNLRSFSISGSRLNKMSGPLTLPKLKEVKIEVWHTPKDLQYFFSLPNLEILKIVNTKLNASDFAGIEHCTSLKYISLKGCSLDRFPKHILMLTQLEKINLKRCSITTQEHKAIGIVLEKCVIVSDKNFRMTSLEDGQILKTNDNPCKDYLSKDYDYLRDIDDDFESFENTLYFDGTLNLEGDFDLKTFGAEQIIVSGSLNITGTLTSSSDVRLAVFGSFSSPNVLLENGSIHTFGTAQVSESIKVMEGTFFTAHGPIKASTIYSFNKNGFGFARLECRTIVDAVGDNHEGTNRQGDIQGRVLGLTAARKAGLLE